MNEVMRTAQIGCVQGSLVEQAEINDSTVIVKIRVDANERFRFQPGQYVNIISDQYHYPLSIACVPNEENILEFHIKVDALSYRNQKLHELLKFQNNISIQGPFGGCTFNIKSPRTPIFVAIGLGISQIKGLLEYALNLSPSEKHYLVWGVRSEQDLYLNDYWRKLKNIYPNFEYIPVLSQPVSSDWRGATGYVQEFLPDVIESKSDDYDIYVAGGKQSVECVIDALLQLDVKPTQLHYDRW